MKEASYYCCFPGRLLLLWILFLSDGTVCIAHVSEVLTVSIFQGEVNLLSLSLFVDK
jgi:hypothetical protein